MGLAVLGYALPRLLDPETLTREALTDRWAPKGLVARVAHLKSGPTHFELAGPADGPLVVLVHGVSGPMQVWDKTVQALVGAGMRVLRFDLYGRGLSERIEGAAYDLDLYVEQLEGIIQDAAPAAGAVHLVGSSMGAIIASEFTRRHTAAVRALTLIGPAGFPLQASPLAELAQMPGIGDWLMRVAGQKSLADHDREYFYEPAKFKEFEDLFEEQLLVQGSKRAILQTLRNTPLQSFLPVYREVGRLGVPVQILWGVEDRAFPFSNKDELLKAMPKAKFVAVEKAGHLPQLEAATVVGPELSAFAMEHPR